MRAAALVCALFAFGLAPVFARPAAAQTTEQTEAAIRDFAAWSQAVNVVNADLIAVYRSSDTLNALVDSFLEGEKDERTAMAGIETWRREFVAEIESLRVRFDAIAVPPMPAGLERLDTVLQSTSMRMRQAFGEGGEFANGMAEISRRNIRGELDGHSGALQRAQALVQRLVEFENGSLAIRKASSAEGHPNRPMSDATITLNNAVLIVFEALVEPEADLLNSDQRARLRASAAELRRHVVDGRAAAANTRAEVQSGLSRFSPEMRTGIMAVFDSLGATFDTLDGAAVMLDEMSQTRANDKDADLMTFLERFDAVSTQLGEQNRARAILLPTQAPTL